MRISASRVNTIVFAFLPPFSTVMLVLSTAVTTPVNWCSAFRFAALELLLEAVRACDVFAASAGLAGACAAAPSASTSASAIHVRP